MKLIFITVFLALSLLILSGCEDKVEISPDADKSAANQTISTQTDDVETIIIKDFAFMPSSVTIRQGTSVRWENQDSASHTIKSGIINSDTIPQGGSFEYFFDKLGTYDYICGLHPSMKGRIVVE